MRVRIAAVAISAIYLVAALALARMLFSMTTKLAEFDPTMVQLTKSLFQIGASAGCIVTIGIMSVAIAIRELVVATRSARKAALAS